MEAGYSDAEPCRTDRCRGVPNHTGLCDECERAEAHLSLAEQHDDAHALGIGAATKLPLDAPPTDEECARFAAAVEAQRAEAQREALRALIDANNRAWWEANRGAIELRARTVNLTAVPRPVAVAFEAWQRARLALGNHDEHERAYLAAHDLLSAQQACELADLQRRWRIPGSVVIERPADDGGDERAPLARAWSRIGGELRVYG